MSVDSTSIVLSLIFNRSLIQEEIPGDWKSANVVLIFKKGSICDKNNYKLVSLTSIVGKLLESIIRDQVQHFLDENKFIQANMVSLRVTFFYRIFEWYDKGESLDIIYLDFSKAFGYGIHENVLRWIVKWLEDKNQ